MERQHRLGAEARLRDSLVVQDLVEKASVSLVVVRKLLGLLFVFLDRGDRNLCQHLIMISFLMGLGQLWMPGCFVSEERDRTQATLPIFKALCVSGSVCICVCDCG